MKEFAKITVKIVGCAVLNQLCKEAAQIIAIKVLTAQKTKQQLNMETDNVARRVHYLHPFTR